MRSDALGATLGRSADAPPGVRVSVMLGFDRPEAMVKPGLAHARNAGHGMEVVSRRLSDVVVIRAT